MKQFLSFGFLILTAALVGSCNLGPRESEVFPSPIHLTQISTEGLSKDLHKVVVLEIQHTSTYQYLKVNEDGREFWIAVRKGEIHVGQTYFYKESLLKTKFKSKQLQKVYDSLYLVTKLIPESELAAIHEAKN